MYCPSCGASVDSTEAVCPECGVAPAEARPGPAPDPTIQLTSILSSGDPALIAVAQSLLEGEGIEYLIRSEGLQDLFGWGRVGAGFNLFAGPAEFVVRDEDAHRARELLADLLTPTDRNEAPPSEPD